MRNRLDKKIEVWGNTKSENKLGEKVKIPQLLKSVWAEIIPQTGSLQKQQADTILSNVTHKIKLRYAAGKDIKQDMWIIYSGHRFDINYILNPFFGNETLEIFCTELIE